MTIDYLAHHPGAIPQLAAWGYAEWRPVFDQLGMTLEDVVATFESRARIDGLPLALVAIENGVVAGTGALKESDLPLRSDLTPWLGGMLVDPAQRRRGIGTALIARLIEEARRLGLDRLYLWTPS
ncbi:MAG: GNAT family N-acetyltransferase, partial [Verrucomicrobiota bacterium]|nr:GNAT family N-acetyltransferase [Verrucomicrobiota bacterium]